MGRYEWVDGRIFRNKDFIQTGANSRFYVKDLMSGESILVATWKMQGRNKIVKVDERLYNQEFWNFCMVTALELLDYTPKEFQTFEIQKTMVETTKRVDMFKNIDLERLQHECGIDKLEEVCLTLINRLPRAICNLPKEFMTANILDRAVIAHKNGLKNINRKYRTLKRCISSVVKYGITLEYVPEEFWGVELDSNNNPIVGDDVKLGASIKLYELAVYVNGKTLSVLPDALKDSFLCEIGVINNPDAIVDVPVSYITSEFLKKLYDAGKVVPAEHLEYVRKCVSQNEESLLSPESEIFSCEEDYNKIELESLPTIIGKKTLEYLFNYKVHTVGDLLTVCSDTDIINNFSASMRGEILGLVNVLRCKYLNKDPEVDWVSPLTSVVLVTKLGISTRKANVLIKRYFGKSLMYIMLIILFENCDLEKTMDFDDLDELKRKHEFAKRTIQNELYSELYDKFMVLVEYYRKSGSCIIDWFSIILIEVELVARAMSLELNLSVEITTSLLELSAVSSGRAKSVILSRELEALRKCANQEKAFVKEQQIIVLQEKLKRHMQLRRYTKTS